MGIAKERGDYSRVGLGLERTVSYMPFFGSNGW